MKIMILKTHNPKTAIIQSYIGLLQLIKKIKRNNDSNLCITIKLVDSFKLIAISLINFQET